jgi:Cu-processing system ATP-binding protein
MIAIADLRKKYGSREVLRDVRLNVRKGRVTAIVGPNGAGKTTLIKSVLGLARPDAGVIVLDGERVNGDCRYRSRIGYMPQIARFPENHSARELVAMLRNLRAPNALCDERLVHEFHLEPEMDKPLRTVSGGTRQKVNAVLAFLFAPPLLILDEPTAGLDPVASSILKDRILADRADGTTFVVTSHIMNEVAELADDVVFVLDGTVRFAGSVTDLLAETSQASLERAVAQLMLMDQAR